MLSRFHSSVMVENTVINVCYVLEASGNMKCVCVCVCCTGCYYGLGPSSARQPGVGDFPASATRGSAESWSDLQTVASCFQR